MKQLEAAVEETEAEAGDLQGRVRCDGRFASRKVGAAA